MILPCSENISQFKRFPLTWTLLALNVFLFILIFSGISETGLSSAKALSVKNLTISGRLYHQYLQNLPAEELAQRPAWVKELQSGNAEQMIVLGAYALRDSRFLGVAEKLSFYGDQIQILEWKESLAEFQKKYKEQLLYRFGLSALEARPLAWITYQFSHSNWVHLLSNAVFLVLIGAAVEAMVGSGALVVLYILGGFAGGLGFLILDPYGTIPMVGASASISALLAFYCFAEARPRVRYLYFVSPLQGHYGAIYLPTLLIVPLYLVSDLANLWSTPAGMGGGVAYAAHLGGAVLGVALGVLYRLRKASEKASVTL